MGNRCWSAEALRKRRERAVRRGYVQARASPGRQFMEVDAAVAARGKLMLKSLELHYSHERIAGTTYHHARLATRAVEPIIGAEAAKSAYKSHRCAGPAKHGCRTALWADMEDPAEPAASSGDRQCEITSYAVQHGEEAFNPSCTSPFAASSGGSGWQASASGDIREREKTQTVGRRKHPLILLHKGKQLSTSRIIPLQKTLMLE